MNADNMESRVQELMTANKLYGEVWTDGDAVCVEISWGDWKHEHLRLEYLVSSNIAELIKSESQVTEEDGSDCYSAIHRFFFQKVATK
jgi:hypothetical protein